jgi:Ca2+-binding EF-hand superfamily protein
MGKKDMKKKTKKSTSNVFSQFEQQQIQEFKEAFQMIDADRNGIITPGDLKATYASLGVRDINQDDLDNMCAEAGAPVNFTIFLSMLADKLQGTDPEDVILKAFKVFDKENKGTVHKDHITTVLKANADRFNDDEINQMFTLCAPNEEGQFDYKALCYTLTHGAEPEDSDEEDDE